MCHDIDRYIENAAAGEISPDANKLDVKILHMIYVFMPFSYNLKQRIHPQKSWGKVILPYFGAKYNYPHNLTKNCLKFTLRVDF